MIRLPQRTTPLYSSAASDVYKRQVINDITYLEKNWSKIKGIFLTHGHEDHIGGLPYFLKAINVPVYGTRLTIGLVEHKLKEHNLLSSVKLVRAKYGNVINAGQNFSVEFLSLIHISEPTRQAEISYAVFCLKKKKKKNKKQKHKKKNKK